MDLRHKHHALIWIVALLAVFLSIVGWYMLRPGSAQPGIPEAPSATTTPAAILAPPRTFTDSNRFYEVTAKYPSATPLEEEGDAAAVAAMEAYIQQQARDFAANANVGLMSPEEAALAFPDGRMYTLDIDYSTATGPRTVSYTFTLLADTLGAHPNVGFRTFTFDTKTGAELKLSDLFRPGSQHLQVVSARANEYLARTLRERMESLVINEEMLAAGTRPVADNFQWFRIEGSTLILIFPPYQVAPYALGTLEVPLPLAQLSGILRPEYRP
jgi:hypothetical protein